METTATPKVAKKITPFRLSTATKKQLEMIRQTKGLNSDTAALEYALELVAKALEGQKQIDTSLRDIKAVQQALA